MKKFFVILFIFILLSVFSGCNNIQNNPNSYEEPTSTPSGVAPVVQPHGEKTYEEMIAFINTVDENSFEDGQFKSIIDRVREENYIIRPLYDGEPAMLADRGYNGSLYIEPYYKHNGIPHQFMYHLESDGYKYRIKIKYIEETYLDVAESDGFAGYIYYSQGDITGEWKKEEFYKNRMHQNIFIAESQRNVILISDSETEKIIEAQFVWDKYLVSVVGDINIDGVEVYSVCNTDILTHLSFEKVPLK